MAFSLTLSVAPRTAAGQDPPAQGKPQQPPLAKAATQSEGEGLFYLWSVLTRDTVRDNFGHYIAARFYVVELLLNNQYDRKLIITGVGFNTLQDGQDVALAATDPQTIKGILIKKDLIGQNARFKNVVMALGLLLTGSSGFFKNVGAAASYNRSINLFNDPFQKGISLVSPNTIVKYLETMNQDIYKTGLVLPEGSLGYLRVFVDKNNVFPPSVLKALSPQQRRELYDPTEPVAVQKILRELVIQGQKVEKLVPITLKLNPPK